MAGCDQEEAEDLHALIDLGLKNNEIASQLGCSATRVKTLRRRLHLRKTDFSSAVNTDAELDEMVSTIIAHHPNHGCKMLLAHLEHEGVRVQRDRVRESLRRVDPEGVARRQRGVLRRRRYSVEGPNSLWHIDGYHKLIRWKLVIHGGVDGYSRLPVFLRCSSNNKSKSMFMAFNEGIMEFGLPRHIRSDKGGENVMVADFMLQHPLRGPDQGCFITGRSVHNQRIERFWRDLYSGCVQTYHTLFYQLEDEGCLDASSDLDIYALRYVFLPVINNHLRTYQQSYMRHKLRTEHNQTPLQLWSSGIHAVDSVGQEEVNQFLEVAEEEQQLERVQVPPSLHLTEEQERQLHENFDVTAVELAQRDDQLAYYNALQEFLTALVHT